MKRGPLATERDPMGFCATPVLRTAIVKWAENQPDLPSLSEATRRLVELGLTVKAKGRRPSDGQKPRARDGRKAIDEMTDAAATPDDQATRKKRLLKGPEESERCG